MSNVSAAVSRTHPRQKQINGTKKIMTPRVAHFIETNIPGGAEQVLIDLARYTRDNTAFRPVVLHFEHPFFSERCEQYAIEHIIIPERIHRLFKSIKTLPLFAWHMGRFLKQHNIQLLHSHLYGPITGGALAAALARIPHIGTLHDVHMIEENPRRILLIKLATFLGTEFVAVSKQMQAFYCQHAPRIRPHIQTIYNGLDSERNTSISPSEKAALRAQLKIHPTLTADDIIIICTGRLVALKQVDMLIKAFDSLHKTFKSCKLLIVGEGPEQASLEKMALDLQLDHYIFFTGFRQDVAHLLACSDIFVQCSTTEGLSRSILEAMATPLPCIVTDVGGNSELIQSGENGYLIAVDKPQALTEKLQTLCNDAQLRNTLAKNSLAKISGTFSRHATFQQYIQLYTRQLS